MTNFLTTGTAIKFLKFGVVGFSGMLVDFGLTYLFKEKFKIQKYIANAIGFTSAASSNYILNRIWTFNSHNPEIALEYGRFLGISLIGLLINTLVIYLLVSKSKVNFYLAKLAAIVIVTIWNFVVNLNYTFVNLG
ncbi:MAG TPA: GtrA family protein [Lentimicrobium sp.]|nr:GtrA family protein [Lentimicrobium sp.]